jgi:hypothetical protein
VEQGQPEVEDSLGLPTDEDSYNELKVLAALGRPSTSGTHHFVSSSFPGRITCYTIKDAAYASLDVRTAM